MITKDQLAREYSGNRKVSLKVKWFKARDAVRGIKPETWLSVSFGAMLVVLFALMTIR